MKLTNKVYDLLKPVALIYLPALAVLYTALAALWGFPSVKEVVGSISAVDAFLGTVLHLSSSPSPVLKDGTPTDGQFLLKQDPSGERAVMTLDLKTPPEEIIKKDFVILKMTKDTSS